MADHFITTNAKETRCHRCGAPILTAHDEGLPARVDTTPLRDRHAEINALLDGRRTYTHTQWGQLHYRDEFKLRRTPNTSEQIHAEHKCVTNEQLALDVGAAK